MIPQAGFPDGFMFDDVMAETSGLLNESVAVKRYTGVTGGDPAGGTAPTKTYATFQMTFLIESLSAQEIAASNGFYIAGDLRAQSAFQLYGSEGGANGAAAGDLQTAGRYSDLITYRGREYKIIGHPERIHYGGQYYWTAVMRQNQA